jgi:hypothetical protein
MNQDKTVEDGDEKDFIQRIIKAKHDKIYTSNLKKVLERLSHIIFLVIICAGIFIGTEFEPGLTIASAIFCIGFI